jgi:hypothetical protein
MLEAIQILFILLASIAMGYQPIMSLIYPVDEENE